MKRRLFLIIAGGATAFGCGEKATPRTEGGVKAGATGNQATSAPEKTVLEANFVVNGAAASEAKLSPSEEVVITGEISVDEAVAGNRSTVIASFLTDKMVGGQRVIANQCNTNVRKTGDGKRRFEARLKAPAEQGKHWIELNFWGMKSEPVPVMIKPK